MEFTSWPPNGTHLDRRNGEVESLALLDGCEAHRQADDVFPLARIREFLDLLPMDFDSGAKVGLPGEDQREKPKGGIPSVKKDEIVGFHMFHMLGGQGSLPMFFRTDDGVYDNAVEDVKQVGDSGNGARLTLYWIPCSEMIGAICCPGNFGS